MNKCPKCDFGVFVGVCERCGHDPEIALYKLARRASRPERWRKLWRRLRRRIATAADQLLVRNLVGTLSSCQRRIL